MPRIRTIHIESIKSPYFPIRYDISWCLLLDEPGDQGFYTCDIFVTDHSCPIEESHLGEFGEWQEMEEARCEVRKHDDRKALERAEIRAGVA